MLRHRATSRILDANAETEGLKKMTYNIEMKLLDVREDIEKLKSAKSAYLMCRFI